MKKKVKKKAIVSVEELVDRWTQASGDNQHLSEIRDLVKYLSTELYEAYQPYAVKPLFWNRLAKWLQNVSSKHDQQLLLEFVPWLMYVGQKEMETMYQAAFSGPITRWIIDESRLDISAPDLSLRFAAEIKRTFFGSIAGMDINSFARINGLAGQGNRPNFRELSKLGNFDQFKHEIEGNDFQRIVAVEDMVGTGTQMVEAAPILAHLSPMKVLLCPIVVAPHGVTRWENDLQTQNPQFTFSPLFVIPSNATLPEAPGAAVERDKARKMRSLIQKTWPQVRGANPSNQLYGPFGFGDFGSLVLTYLNCPDNVPPMIHYQSDQWEPLFPRVPREQ